MAPDLLRRSLILALAVIQPVLGVASTSNRHSSEDNLKNPRNTTYNNPILPGFHPDPSCIFVPEFDNTFFCASSSFLAFPSIPIHASKDLINWRLIGHALSRPSQWDNFGNTTLQLGGMFAPTIRYHQGRLYVVAAYVAIEELKLYSFLFNTTNPYTPDAWGNPVFYDGPGIDPSLFFADNGTAYLQVSQIAPAGIVQSTIDVATGTLGSFGPNVWNGTGGASPEGPHLYEKDGFYYLMIAEGGTELNHMETIARSRAIDGTFEAYSQNPILTNANTTQYFQTVGHADLFQDANGNWWGVALATRCGPEYKSYPMGRETVLFPATWKEGEWPILQPVRGTMRGPLPPKNLKVKGSGEFISTPDAVNFAPKSSLPMHFTYWRYPRAAYTVSPAGHPNTLRLEPSNLNLTASAGYNALDGQTFISRRQVDSRFTYSVDMDFSPAAEEEEAGVSAFLRQERHLDMGIVLLKSKSSGQLAKHMRFRAVNNTLYIPPDLATVLAGADGSGAAALGSILGEGEDVASTNDTSTVVVPVPSAWGEKKIRLQIQAKNATHFTFSAASVPPCDHGIELGTYPASLVSGGFTGLLLGAYATTNGGGENGTKAYVSRWRYSGQGQIIN